MNASRKKAAVKKFDAMREGGKTYKDIRTEMSEFGYKPEEITEVVAAIQADRGDEDEKIKMPTPVAEAGKNRIGGPGYPHMYEEWEVRWNGKEWIKLLKVRSNVKITEEEAANHNGNYEPSSLNPHMYFVQED